MFTGTYTAIVTPFNAGAIDQPALKKLIDAQVRAGVDGIVPVGTTGESPTVSYEEHIEIIAASVRYAGRRIKVIAGSGGNSTNEAVYLTQKQRKPARMVRCKSRLIIISRPKKDCSNISAKWPATPSFRSFCIAFQAAAASRSASTQSGVSSKTAQISSASKRPAAPRIAFACSGLPWDPNS